MAQLKRRYNETRPGKPSRSPFNKLDEPAGAFILENAIQVFDGLGVTEGYGEHIISSLCSDFWHHYSTLIR